MERDLRLDAELVRRGLARSREHAVSLVAAGAVRVGERVAQKPAARVPGDAELTVDTRDPVYVGRGADKLAGALDRFAVQRPPGPVVAGRRCLDAGASTGGFTEVLLRRGAASVVAVDVGHDQLAPSLRADPRVEVHEGVNVRTLQPGDVGARAELVVADLSFISLTLVLAPLVGVCAPDADLLLMVKPQFEVGRERLGRGGVVREPALRAESVLTVARHAAGLGLGTVAVTASPLPGPAGNVEYFLWLHAAAAAPDPAMVHTAVEEGPP